MPPVSNTTKKKVEISEELKVLLGDNYSLIFDNYSNMVKEGLDEYTVTKGLVDDLYEETKRAYDTLGTSMRNIGLKVELGKTLADLIKSKNSITKEKFAMLDKSTLTMTKQVDTIKEFARTGDGNKKAFNPVDMVNKLNTHITTQTKRAG